MDVMEKLVELIENGVPCPDGRDPFGEYCDTCRYSESADCSNERLADYLISHGVTVQEWISVKERLPQENEPEGTLCESVQVLLNNGKVSVGWCNRRTKLWYHMNYDEDYFISNDYDHTPVIAWQPLAQPPKGE